MILVSACLLGECCKYTGGHNHNAAVQAYLAGRDYLPCCPEVLGGLPTPRPPAEIKDGDGAAVLAGNAHVCNKTGQDITDQFTRGAQAALSLCLEHKVDLAILKERSPSCGVYRIYNGSFSGKTMPGQGVCAALLRQAGIRLLSEEDLEQMPAS